VVRARFCGRELEGDWRRHLFDMRDRELEGNWRILGRRRGKVGKKGEKFCLLGEPSRFSPLAKGKGARH
jgi:hypothetical protein